MSNQMSNTEEVGSAQAGCEMRRIRPEEAKFAVGLIQNKIPPSMLSDDLKKAIRVLDDYFRQQTRHFSTRDLKELKAFLEGAQANSGSRGAFGGDGFKINPYRMKALNDSIAFLDRH